MTLSILIPTFNYDARALVSSMLYLLSAEGIEGEVIEISGGMVSVRHGLAR